MRFNASFRTHRSQFLHESGAGCLHCPTSACHCEGAARGNPYSFRILVLVVCTTQLPFVIARSDSQESRRGNLSKPENGGRELVTMSCTASRNWYPVSIVLLNIGEIPTSGVSGRLPRNDIVLALAFPHPAPGFRGTDCRFPLLLPRAGDTDCHVAGRGPAPRNDTRLCILQPFRGAAASTSCQSHFIVSLRGRSPWQSVLL